MRINEITYKRITNVTKCIEDIGSNFIQFIGKTSQILGEYNYEVFNNFANSQRDIILKAFIALKNMTCGNNGFIEDLEKFPSIMKSDGSKLYSYMNRLEEVVYYLVKKSESIEIINNDTSNPIIPDNKYEIYQELYNDFRLPKTGIYDVNFAVYLLNQYDDEDDIIADILNNYQQKVVQSFGSIVLALEQEFKNLGKNIGLEPAPFKLKPSIVKKNSSVNFENASKDSGAENKKIFKFNIVKKGIPFVSKKQSVHKSKIYNREEEEKLIIEDIKNGSGKNISKDTASRMWESINDYSGPGYTAIRSAYNDPNPIEELKMQLDSIDEYIKGAPKWEGKIYRGINLSERDATNILLGKLIDMRGPSSWSSDEKTACNFSQKNKPVNMVFVLNNNMSGASITHIARYNGGESEVLVSSGVQYSIDSHERINRNGIEYTYVYVHEMK